MEQQVTELCGWWEVDTTHGMEWIPDDLCKGSPEGVADYVQGDVYSVRHVIGYGARLSAPGYMDCTEWCVFDTEREAEEYLQEMYGDDFEEE